MVEALMILCVVSLITATVLWMAATMLPLTWMAVA